MLQKKSEMSSQPIFWIEIVEFSSSRASVWKCLEEIEEKFQKWKFDNC